MGRIWLKRREELWDTIPVTATGNFQISFQVYNDTYDGDSHILLLNTGTDAGVDVRNSPQGTDTPNINIFSGTNFTNFSQFFFPTPAATLATAQATHFPNQTWTQVTITLNNGILADNVGGQVILANVSGLLTSSIQLGLGGYATTYNPDPGVDPDLINEILFRNFSVEELPEPCSSDLLLLGFLILIVARWSFAARSSAALPAD
jgi:hypothetical protein